MWYESRKAQNQVVNKPHGEWYRKGGGVNERGWKEKREDVVQVSTSKAFLLRGRHYGISDFNLRCLELAGDSAASELRQWPNRDLLLRSGD